MELCVMVLLELLARLKLAFSPRANQPSKYMSELECRQCARTWLRRKPWKDLDLVWIFLWTKGAIRCFSAPEGMLDFLTEDLCQFLPERWKFLSTCFEASLADRHQMYNIGLGKKRERKQETTSKFGEMDFQLNCIY